ncbi:MAG: hypothetical protein FWD69_01025 [Polyangiaceae bacterium]|nr:hypothetical protein [Polyangiaceae bacterium]
MRHGILLVALIAAGCTGYDVPSVDSVDTGDAGGDAGRSYSLSMLEDVNTMPVVNANGYIEIDHRVFFGARAQNVVGYALYSLNSGSVTPTVVATRSTWLSSPVVQIASGGKLYFTVTDAIVGNELWVSDGSDGGTELLVDGYPGTPSGFQGILGEVSGRLLFVESNTNGRTLWSTNGDPASTVQVKSGPAPVINSVSGSAALLGGKLVFSASDNSGNGTELWVTDGTADGTVLLKDIYPGAASSSPMNFVAFNNRVFFAANDGTHGMEPWITDGTAAGTVLVSDIYPGAGGSISSNMRFVAQGGFVYFQANDGTYGAEPWRSDGTEDNTTIVADLYPGLGSSSPTGFTALGSKVIFQATDATHGTELFVTNGTAAGTSMVLDINPGYASSSISGFAVLGNQAYFSANDGTHGNELWRTDGTSLGTSMVSDFVPGSGSGLYGSPVVANGVLFLDGGDTGIPDQSDGTMMTPLALGATGTQPSSPSGFVAAGGNVFFMASDFNDGNELWVNDTSGTHLVTDINPGRANGVVSGSSLRVLGDRVYFSGTTPDTGTELWTSDGTAAGTTLVKDVQPGVGSGIVGSPVSYEGNIYFFSNNTSAPASTNVALWTTDGTEQGTQLVADLDSSPSGLRPQIQSIQSMGVYNDVLMFTILDNLNLTSGLFALDPTTKSDILQIGPTVDAMTMSTAILITEGHQDTYFAMSTGIYRTRGAAPATLLTPLTTTPSALIEKDDAIVYAVGGAILKIDETSTALTPLEAMTPTSGFVLFGDGIYFLGGNGTVGMGLWRMTALTPQSSELVRSFVGNLGSTLVVFDNHLFFSASDPTTGQELWMSDGTTEGTVLVLDANPGSASSSITSLTPLHDALYMSLNDGFHGAEPWWVH